MRIDHPAVKRSAAFPRLLDIFWFAVCSGCGAITCWARSLKTNAKHCGENISHCIVGVQMSYPKSAVGTFAAPLLQQMPIPQKTTTTFPRALQTHYQEKQQMVPRFLKMNFRGSQDHASPQDITFCRAFPFPESHCSC